jgi:chemotaxis protein methyltransferase CheR
MDRDSAERFLDWATSELHLRRRGYQRVKGQVLKRVASRCHELGLGNLDDYRQYVEERPEEMSRLDMMFRVTISRFWRDAEVFNVVADRVLPLLAQTSNELMAWSLGCASGEETYSLVLAIELGMRPRWPGLRSTVVGVDVVIARASVDVDCGGL